MPIDSVIIDAIKQKADIAEVVSDHIKLEKQGQNYIGLCPFHDDSTPSLTVNTTKGIYKCFACGATGDVIDFLQKYLKITFPEAVKMLSDKYGIEMSGESTPQLRSCQVLLREPVQRFQRGITQGSFICREPMAFGIYPLFWSWVCKQ